jgi:hypothetical protein
LAASDDWSRMAAGLGADLYAEGYENILNIDVSSVVVRQMSDLFAELENMECKASMCLVSLSLRRIQQDGLTHNGLIGYRCSDGCEGSSG